MSKRKRMNQDKKDDALGQTSSRVGGTTTASAGLPLNKGPPAVAAAILSELPDDVTLQSKQAKDLLRAFDLVKTELQRRTNEMTTKSEKAGALQQVSLSGVSVPVEVTWKILEWLPRYQVVHNASLVCKSWLSLCRSPRFWKALDSANGLTMKSSQVKNMTDLLTLIRRPQFSSLKLLVPPHMVQLRKKALENIAQHCPLLEEIHMGYDSHFPKMKPSEADIMSLPSLFPYMDKIRLGTHQLTNSAIQSFCEVMGSRPRSIRILDSYSCNQKMTDSTIVAIGRHCPNLEVFEYSFSSHTLVEQNPLSTDSIVSLLTSCTGLHSLGLIRCPNVGLPAFRFILQDAVKLQRLLVVEHYNLMSDNVLCEGLTEKLVSFDAITNSEHRTRCCRARAYGTSWGLG